MTCMEKRYKELGIQEIRTRALEWDRSGHPEIFEANEMVTMMIQEASRECTDNIPAVDLDVDVPWSSPGPFIQNVVDAVNLGSYAFRATKTYFANNNVGAFSSWRFVRVWLIFAHVFLHVIFQAQEEEEELDYQRDIEHLVREINHVLEGDGLEQGEFRRFTAQDARRVIQDLTEENASLSSSSSSSSDSVHTEIDDDDDDDTDSVVSTTQVSSSSPFSQESPLPDSATFSSP